MIYIQGFCFFCLMMIATYYDVKYMIVPNIIHVFIFITAFINFNTDFIISMIFGAVITALPLYIAAFIKNESIGGADIKYMASSGFLLGVEKGFSALIIGLLAAILFIVIYRKLKKLDMKMAFPLIPFLSFGNIVAFII